MASPKEIIENIRERWGLGLSDSVDPRTTAALKHYQRQFGNSLTLLSDQLYQSESHFFLEILQNADDNDYDVQIPALDITVSADGIIFENNERGFTEANVRALCGVGESTKKNRKEAQIGEKGIGFKAVFQFSDCPEVHSNGFHFRFDRQKYAELGLVIPEWVDGDPNDGPATGTQIILKRKPDVVLDVDLFKNLKPELLLFLRRLRRLSVHDGDSNRRIVLERRDVGPIARITCTVEHSGPPETSEHDFFLHGRTVDVQNLNESLRPGLTETDIVIALPVAMDGSADARTDRFIFAFLPIEPTDFGFVIHADFVLSTSRETIRHTLAWNMRLRNELGVALADALLAAHDHPVLGRTALRFLKDPSKIGNEFLAPIMDTAITRLKSMPSVPTSEGEWSGPDVAVRQKSPGLAALIPSKDFKQLLNADYVDSSIDGIDGPLALLGCETFTLVHLLRCVASDAWIDSRSPQWFAELYNALSDQFLSNDDIALLKKARLVRLQDGKVVAPASDSVYRSLSRRTNYDFEHELKLLDPATLDASPAVEMAKVTKLLANLGIRDATPARIIEYIAEVHAGSNWDNHSSRALVGQVRYVRNHIKAHLEELSDEAKKNDISSRLRTSLRIRSSKRDDEESFEHPDQLYLGRSYADPHDLQSLFAGQIDDKVVSAEYILGSSQEEKANDRQNWSAFLRWLGVHTLPRVVEVIGSSNFSPSPELDELMNSDDWARKSKLLALLDRQWVTHYSRLISRARNLRGPPSIFLTKLQAMTVLTANRASAKLENTYLDTEPNRAAFGLNVPYLNSEFVSGDFLEATGVIGKPTVEQVLERLEEIREADLDVSQIKKEVRPLYAFLDTRFPQHADEIREAFRSRKLVYLDLPDKGGWALLDDCCWNVPRALRGYAPVQGLSRAWAGSSDFFRKRLAIREEMTAEQWVETLEELKKAELDVEDTAALALQIYLRLDQEVRHLDHGAPEPSWLEHIRAGHLLWTKTKEWSRNEDDVVASDDRRIEELFADCEKVAFIDIRESELPRYASFLKAVNIFRVSDLIDVSIPDAVSLEPALDVATRFQHRWLYVARLLFHMYPDAYVAASESGSLVAMRDMPVQLAAPLKLTVHLCGESADHRFDARALNGPTGIKLLIDSESIANWDVIAIELARLLGDTDSVSLARVLSEDSPASVESWLSTIRVPELPESERRSLCGEAPVDEEEEEEPSRSADDDSGQDANIAREPVTAPTESAALDSNAASKSSTEIAQDDGEGAAPDAATRHAPDRDAADETVSTSERSSSLPRDAISSSQAQEQGGREHAKGGGVGGATRTSSGRTSRPAGPPTSPDRAGQHGSAGSKSNERLFSYTMAPAEDGAESEPDGLSQQLRESVEEAAVNHVLEHERSQGRHPESQIHSNPGYDVASSSADGDLLRYIEVKGTSGERGRRGVPITPTQFQFALNHRDKTWLYVVEHALDPDHRQLYCVSDFAARVWRFMFDGGWNAVAENDDGESLPPAPKPGDSWHLKDGRLGTVTAIEGAGRLLGVRVRPADGTAEVREQLTPERFAHGRTGGD